MPRVHKHKARRRIYQNGVRTENPNNKSGYSIDRSKPKNDRDKLLVDVGQEYWTWQFKNSPPQFSLTPPDKRQLTRSDYQLSLYDIEDEISAVSEAKTPEDLQAAVEEIKSQIENLRDEQEEKRSNMPEQLQDSGSGEILQERYDALDNAYSELDGIDLEYDEPDEDELRHEIEDERGVPDEQDEDEAEEITNADIEAKREEKLEDWLSEKIDEIQSVSLE